MITSLSDAASASVGGSHRDYAHFHRYPSRLLFSSSVQNLNGSPIVSADPVAPADPVALVAPLPLLSARRPPKRRKRTTGGQMERLLHHHHPIIQSSLSSIISIYLHPTSPSGTSSFHRKIKSAQIGTKATIPDRSSPPRFGVIIIRRCRSRVLKFESHPLVRGKKKEALNSSGSNHQGPHAQQSLARGFVIPLVFKFVFCGTAKSGVPSRPQNHQDKRRTTNLWTIVFFTWEAKVWQGEKTFTLCRREHRIPPRP